MSSDFRISQVVGTEWGFTGHVPMELARKTWPDRYAAVRAANDAGYDVFADGSVKPQGDDPAEEKKPAKIKFTGKVRRGLALMRMVQMAAQDDSCPPIQTMIGRWTKAQQGDYNAALAWCEQEEDWDAVADAWERGRTGKR